MTLKHEMLNIGNENCLPLKRPFACLKSGANYQQFQSNFESFNLHVFWRESRDCAFGRTFAGSNHIGKASRQCVFWDASEVEQHIWKSYCSDNKYERPVMIENWIK